MHIPEPFRHKISRSFGERGSAWLAELPHLYDRAVRKWGLTNCSPSPEMFYKLLERSAPG